MTFDLFSGITLTMIKKSCGTETIRRDALDHVLELFYLRTGKVDWKMAEGNDVHLGPHDFCLYTGKMSAESVMTVITEACEGMILRFELNTMNDNMPDILSGSGITGEFLYEKFCGDADVSSIAGDEHTEQIFAPFFEKTEPLAASYRKVKLLELLLYLSELRTVRKNRLTEYGSDQIEIIRAIHKELIDNLDLRITIEELSKKYLMNPTTLKAVFKSVYGESIAAHIKEHRMEEAARLLRETDLSIAEIAERVGYDSQSKFTSAFKATFQVLPKEYRKK
ncbi:MAG: AraC family transcriptional regulator [Clostridia bacterium]|nr:AraC family transcriptional regulator [Clostridia bacterium]